MRIVGLDLSLTATGVCDYDGAARVIKSKNVGVARLDDILGAINMPVACASLVVIEGYSYGSANSHAHSLGELGGVIRHALWRWNVPWVDCPPKTLKKFATDNGNAAKTAMGIAAAKAGYDGPDDDNCVDAWWLHQFGLYAMDEGDLNRTQYRDKAIGKIVWPELNA